MPKLQASESVLGASPKGATSLYTIFCQHCGVECDEGPHRAACAACGGLLCFRYPQSPAVLDGPSGSMWKYQEVLPIRDRSKIVSMHEGSTPLQKTRFQQGAEIYIKNETVNPTGSHKDRALSIGITKAVEFGCDTVMLYSDGSTALSSAAYAARAGLKNITVVARGTPHYRLFPLTVYNSLLLEFQGTAADALCWAYDACRSLGIYSTSTHRRANPYELEGPKTVGLEIFEQLGRSPNWLVVPVGGGGTLSGIWRAFVELHRLGLTAKRPRMVGVLPEHYTMLEMALAQGAQSEKELRALTPATLPATVQAKISMAYSPDGLEAIKSIRESDGLIIYSSDQEALAAQKKLGAHEGIYAEPSATVSLVAAEKLWNMGKAKEGDVIVAVITGSGFRETEALSDRLTVKTIPVDSSSGILVLEKALAAGK